MTTSQPRYTTTATIICSPYPSRNNKSDDNSRNNSKSDDEGCNCPNWSNRSSPVKTVSPTRRNVKFSQSGSYDVHDFTNGNRNVQNSNGKASSPPLKMNTLPRGYGSSPNSNNFNNVPRGFPSGNASTESISKSTLRKAGSDACASNGSAKPANSVKFSTLPKPESKSMNNNHQEINPAANTNTRVRYVPVRKPELSNVPPAPAKLTVDPKNPDVRKLAYNMYRGLLDKKHDHSSSIINATPSMQVELDEGVSARVISMM